MTKPDPADADPKNVRGPLTSDQRDDAGTQRDEAAEERDQVGDERDQVGDLRDRVAHSRDVAADRRDRTGSTRDHAGVQRDVVGGQRDLAAHLRDEAAERRDTAAELSESRSGWAREPDDPLRSARARRDAASDRKLAMADRVEGARERMEADLDRHAALTDRGEADRDRDAALADREAGATERDEAELDRDIAFVNRGASAKERAHFSFDDLTGVYTRGAGFVELEREIARARREQQPLVLAFIDVDRLKTVNDSQGHAAGDRMLCEVARTLRLKLRGHDLIIRYGGDEFVCAVAGLSLAMARTRFELVSAALEQAPEHGSVTVGLAELLPEDAAEDLVARADGMLYEQRQQRADAP